MTTRTFTAAVALSMLVSGQSAHASAAAGAFAAGLGPAVNDHTQARAASHAATKPADVERAIAGEVKKVDHDARTIVIHTAAGIDETIRFTDRTTVHGLSVLSRAADVKAKAALEGGSVVVRFTGEKADRTAIRIDHLGTRPLKLAKGTVVRVDNDGRFVVVKTKAGTEETFEMTKDLVVQSERGVESATDATGNAIKKGTEITAHYSESGGKKLLHLLEHARPGPLLPPSDPR
jgi:hypothetical protein